MIPVLQDSYSRTMYGASDIPVSSLTMAMVFGVNLIVYLGLRLSSSSSSSSKASSYLVESLKFSKSSIIQLTGELAVFGFILLYVWMCENRPLYPHQQKEHIPDFFWFICFIILMFSFGSIVHEPKSDALVNRNQTEEWKGWMQTVFLLYHYFHASEVYNPVRVMISCYVWMTGFGNLSFFYATSDFGIVRFMQMMWRLNFGVVFLCLTMNNMYMLYYICPLHTFYFLMVYATMRIYKHENHTKYGLRLKLLALSVVIFLVWEFPKIFDVAFFFLPSTPHPGAAVGAYGIKYEWHFRSGLDHYSTLFGMLFQLNFPQATVWMAKVEQLPPLKQTLVKGGIGALLLMASFWWYNEVLLLEKLEFNQVNPYTFMIPLLTYIYFRNCTPWLRQVHLGLLATIGKYTLETYLLQHHIWLTSNAKTVLEIFPNYPKVNLVFVTAIYFTIARRLYRVTMVTRAMLIPNDPVLSCYYLGQLLTFLGTFGLVAWVLQFVQMGWVVVVAVTVLCGVGVLHVISLKLGSPDVSLEPDVKWKSAVYHLSRGVMLASFSLVLLPSLIPVSGFAVNSGPLRRPIEIPTPENCLQSLSRGKWIYSTKGCTETGLTSCINERWSWEYKNCKYKSFKENDAKALLSGRKLTFIGDQQMYEIMAATHSIADPSSGHRANIPSNYVESNVISLAEKDGIKYLSGGIDFVQAASVSNTIDRLNNRVNTLDVDTVVVGVYLKDAMSRVSVERYKNSWNTVAAKLKRTPCIVVLPGSVYDDKLGAPYEGVVSNATAFQYAKAIQESKISEACVLMVNGFAITASRGSDSYNGIRFSSRTYQVYSQIILNAFETQKPPLSYQKQKAASATTKAKGKGGGIAQNPLYGAGVLLLAVITLFAMDNYAGLSVLSSFVFLGYPIRVSWEESVEALHRKLGIVKKNTDKIVGDSKEDDSDGVLMSTNRVVVVG